MQEEYLLKKMIKGKNEKEKEIELMQTIIETKEMLKIAISNFEYAEDDLIDYYTYQIKANQSKLDYLIKIAKRKGIVLSRVNELKTRLYRNNMAGWKKIVFLRWLGGYEFSNNYILYMYVFCNWKNFYTSN